MTLSQRNARFTLVSSFLSDLSFILPIWVLFGTQQLGLSVAVTTALFMVIWLGSGLLEVPTGALADRLGRKRMFLVGSLLLSLYPVFYILRAPVAVILIMNLVAAFGSALRSGALIALTHETYQQEKRSEKDYHAFLSWYSTIAFIARALSGVVGGWLYQLNASAPFVANFGSYIALMLCGLFVVDTAVERSKLTNRAHMAETFREIKQKELLVLLALVYIAFQLVGEAMWTAYQPFFKADNFSPVVIGGMFSVIAVLSAIGSYVVRFAMKRHGVLRIELTVSLGIWLTAILLCTPWRWLHLLAVIPSGIMFGVTYTPINATVQKHVNHKLQATALSMVNLLQYAVYGVASLFIGLMIDRLGVGHTRVLLAAEATAAVIFISILYALRRSKDEIVTAD